MFTKSIQKLREQVMGMNQRNLELIYPHNDKRDYKLADDKYLAKTLMQQHGLACPRTYATISSIGEIDRTWEAIKYWNQLVIKPAKGAGGKGILIIKKQDGKWHKGSKAIREHEIFAHIANIIFGIFSFGDEDKVLVEEYVTPHPFFEAIFPAGVPDFRVILLKNRPLMAMLRMPTNRSNGKANLHQGGVGIGVDLKKGQLKALYDGRKYLDYHPDTKAKVLGLEIPFWNSLLTLSEKTAQIFPLEYMGIDLVIDANKGPMVMEVNVRPGLGIQLANRQGLQSVIH